MKKLCAALLFSFVGMSTYASDLTPKVKPTITTLENKTASKEGKFEVSTKKQSIKKFKRRQMMFTFYDDCGGAMNVWVSGHSSTGAGDLWWAGATYAHTIMNNNGGCF